MGIGGLPKHNAGAGAPCGGVTCNGWNPSDKSAGSTLTNSNLTATASAGSNQGGRSTLHTSAGKIYFESSTGGLTVGNQSGVGIASATAVFTGANCLSCFGATQGYLLMNGRYPWYNGSHLVGGAGDIAPYCGTGGNLDSFALNMDTKRLWVTCGCGTWTDGQNNLGDPVAGTNGFDLSAVFAAADAFAAYSFNAATDTTTANFGAKGPGGMTCVVPSGYKAGWY